MNRTYAYIIVALTAIAAGLLSWNHFRRPRQSGADRWEAHWEEHRQKSASYLRKDLVSKRARPEVDTAHYEHAIELLSSPGYDDEAALYKCILYDHRAYGPMLDLAFVDECESVAQLGFRPAPKGAEDGGSFQVLITYSHIAKKMGIILFRHPLETGSESDWPALMKHATDESRYLRLPEPLYNAIILGGGEIVLANSDGDILDSLAITRVEKP